MKRTENAKTERLPSWIDDASVRLRSVLIETLESGDIGSLSIASVRNQSEEFWRMRSGIGRKGLRELYILVGGFIDCPILTPTERDNLHERIAALEQEVKDLHNALSALLSERVKKQ